jgi:two-component system sensor histidine kinase CiaH
MSRRKGLGWATAVFWILLLYIIAALVWWFVSLERQNSEIHLLKKSAVPRTDIVAYQREWNAINDLQVRNTKKYIGEGSTFLLLIIIGAAYIYRLVRRQFRLQLQQQNFMMAITHELKTPISVARLNLETLQKHRLPEDRQQKLLHITLEETSRLDSLINNILLSSQLDGNDYHLATEEVNLSGLLAESLRQFAARYPSRPLQTAIAPGISIVGDPLLLRLLASNLLENANKYSPAGTPITCQLARKPHALLFAVTDEGIGIPDDEKRNVFNKFYRVGNEQTRRTKGTGLGLFICRKIAQHHHASIAITDNAPAGTTFTVNFKA